MALVRPNLILTLDIDEDLATDTTVAEIRRCYSHICTPIIRKHETSEDKVPRNIATIIVDTNNRGYLDASDLESQAFWEEVVCKWIANMLHKIGNNMKVFNDRQRKIHLPQTIFERLEIVLGNEDLVIGLHTDPVSFVEEDLYQQIDVVRTLFNDGTFKDAVRVDLPAPSVYLEQQEREHEKWLETHEDPEEFPTDGGVDNVDPDLGSIPDKDDEEAYQAWLKADAEAKSYDNTAVPPTDSDELPMPEREEEPEEPELFTFDVDYSIWLVTDSAGGTRFYDSSAKKFV